MLDNEDGLQLIILACYTWYMELNNGLHATSDNNTYDWKRIKKKAG
jgi:hypothetical protein